MAASDGAVVWTDVSEHPLMTVLEGHVQGALYYAIVTSANPLEGEFESSRVAAWMVGLVPREGPADRIPGRVFWGQWRPREMSRELSARFYESEYKEAMVWTGGGPIMVRGLCKTIFDAKRAAAAALAELAS